MENLSPEVIEQLRLGTTRYLFRMLEQLNKIWAGDTTLNQARVMQYVGMRWQEGAPTGVSETARALGIPVTTVSRTVADMLERKVVREESHPDDARRKTLIVTDEFADQRREMIGLLLELNLDVIRENADEWAEMGLMTTDRRESIQQFVSDIVPLLVEAHLKHKD